MRELIDDDELRKETTTSREEETREQSAAMACMYRVCGVKPEEESMAQKPEKTPEQLGAEAAEFLEEKPLHRR